MHYKILNNQLENMKKVPSVKGVLLTGSVALGDFKSFADLDLIILCDKDSFECETINGILVEKINITYDTAIQKLENNPMNVYRYLNSKIMFDNGQLSEIIAVAENIYTNYKEPQNAKDGLYHWLTSTKSKIKSAFECNDNLKINYFTSTNLWKLLEGVWAVNDKPMPPSSSVLRYYNQLQITPYDDWFESLSLGYDLKKA